MAAAKVGGFAEVVPAGGYMADLESYFGQLEPLSASNFQKVQESRARLAA